VPIVWEAVPVGFYGVALQTVSLVLVQQIDTPQLVMLLPDGHPAAQLRDPSPGHSSAVDA
jgi:hypothetical protein